MPDKDATLRTLVEGGLVPVVRLPSVDEARTLADALLEGGISTVEITMSVPGAIGLMAELSKRYGRRLLLGGGTILDPETARAAILAGAAFVVSPHTNPETIVLCRRYGIPVVPGAMTPTEIVRAWEGGADLVKVFPADCLGGPAYIKAIKAPYPQIPLIPTGGVDLSTAEAFIQAGAEALGVGSALVDRKAIVEGRPQEIVEKARRFVAIVKKARGL